MLPHVQTSQVTHARHMACFRQHPGPGVIFHCDRGSQHCSHDFQAALKGDGMRRSMSRKGTAAGTMAR
jgi:putative transposase